MRRTSLALIIVTLSLAALSPRCLGQESTAQLLKQQERYTVSLELEFTKKNSNALQKMISFLVQGGPNGYATGFLVGDGLVMTAYHVVSGELSDSKKRVLGFKPSDELDVRVYVNGCKANVIKVDKDADLALLGVCGYQRQSKAPAFQTTPSKDEKILVIARPHGDKMISRGIFHGPYTLRGQEYWSVRVDGRDGYSGSPVYNQKAEVVGIFSGYDWAQKVALISPGAKAQKLLDDYNAGPKTQ